MASIYGNQHRKLQDNFDKRKLADRIEEITVKQEFDEDTKGFIETRDMFFLSTIDHTGRPTVSYKGGDPGFVKVIDSTTLAFPSYDGNGMYMSMGNITENNKIGMLFIAFDKPHRIRVHGLASIDINDPLLNEYKEADLVVRVKLTDLWQNCPRYIHRYHKEDASRYVPRDACETPLAGWKQTDIVQDVLTKEDSEKAKKLGVIEIGEWIEKIKAGDPTA
jgi:predicted pyridoxine 5'-phosphate oxidase superfamily flavin-nucleotide-binding protein